MKKKLQLVSWNIVNYPGKILKKIATFPIVTICTILINIFSFYFQVLCKMDGLNESLEANLSEPYQPYNERPETYIVPLLFALIFIIGVVGNGTLVAVFVRHKAMRNVPNT